MVNKKMEAATDKKLSDMAWALFQEMSKPCIKCGILKGADIGAGAKVPWHSGTGMCWGCYVTTESEKEIQVKCNKGVFDCAINHHKSTVNPVHSNLAPGQVVYEPEFLLKKAIKKIAGKVPTDEQMAQIKQIVMAGDNTKTAVSMVMGVEFPEWGPTVGWSVSEATKKTPLLKAGVVPIDKPDTDEFAEMLDALPWGVRV